MDKCYRCDAEATTVDHVPPKCLFPEAKDLPDGVDYRKKLITVPACKLHNCDRSKDDEYLLCVLVSSFENNEAARDHFGTKILRLLAKKPKFEEMLLRNRTPVLLDGEETMAFNIDLGRVRTVLESVALGLYFHTFGEEWDYPVSVTPVGLFMQDGTEFVRSPMEQKMVAAGRALFEGAESYGENPDIFYFQIHRELEKQQLVIRMVFYGGFEVIAASSPKFVAAAEASAEATSLPAGT